MLIVILIEVVIYAGCIGQTRIEIAAAAEALLLRRGTVFHATAGDLRIGKVQHSHAVLIPEAGSRRKGGGILHRDAPLIPGHERLLGPEILPVDLGSLHGLTGSVPQCSAFAAVQRVLKLLDQILWHFPSSLSSETIKASGRGRRL